jgi:hypothetical protein
MSPNKILEVSLGPLNMINAVIVLGHWHVFRNTFFELSRALKCCRLNLV